MWDKRYSTDEYVYGTAPNEFLADNYHCLPKGKVLCLADGEGRNGVFLACQGYLVTAVDISKTGLEKAARLAQQEGVSIEIHHADLADYDLGQGKWDAIVSIFCHLPAVLRKKVHAEVVQALKPGGVLLLEAYHPEQLSYGTGGPSSSEMMANLTELRQELSGLDFSYTRELEREVVEGTLHTGQASVVQLIAQKR